MNWLNSLPPGKYEAVLVIGGEDRNNSAAVGVCWDGKNMNFSLFQGSNSYELVDKTGVLGISFFSRDNVYPIVKAALVGYGTDREEFSSEEYVLINGVLVLAAADVNIICKRISVEESLWKDDVGETKIKCVVVQPCDVLVGSTKEFIPPVVGDMVVLRCASAITKAMFLLEIGNHTAAIWVEKAESLFLEISVAASGGDIQRCSDLFLEQITRIKKNIQRM